MDVKYIVIHTAAFNGKNCDADKIDSWHKARGWNGIGYHYVILNDKHDSKSDGTIETGRDENISGAHAYGINSISLGICCVGHGDNNDFTDKQYESLYVLLSKLCTKYQVASDHVIGHRELNRLISKGLLGEQYKTGKTCPGKKVDMNLIRHTLAQQLQDSTPALGVETNILSEADKLAVIDAIETLKVHKMQFSNAGDELEQFLYHPEVIELLSEDSS